MAAGVAQHGGDCATEQLEVALGLDDAAAHERQVVVVGRDALERPQQPGVVLARQVVRGERRRFDAFDVPVMEVFVARRPEQIEIVVRDGGYAVRRQLVSPADEARAGAMLEAAVAFADGGDLEEVAVERRAGAGSVERVDVPPADARQVGGEPVEIGVGCAGHRDVMSYAAGPEVDEGKIRQLDRMIDQGVVALGAIAPEAKGRGAIRRERGRDAPARELGQRRGIDRQLARPLGATLQAQENARAVEVAAPGVEGGGPDGKVVGVDLGDDCQRDGAGRCTPGVLGPSLSRRGSLRVLGAHREEVPGELTNEVAPRHPSGQREAPALRIGIVDRAGNLEEMCMRIEEDEAVAGGWRVVRQIDRRSWRPGDESNVRPAP